MLILSTTHATLTQACCIVGFHSSWLSVRDDASCLIFQSFGHRDAFPRPDLLCYERVYIPVSSQEPNASSQYLLPKNPLLAL